MKLREQINKDYMTAFKEKNTVAKNLLSVIKGEIQTTEKMLDQNFLMKMLLKFFKNLRSL